MANELILAVDDEALLVEDADPVPAGDDGLQLVGLPRGERGAKGHRLLHDHR